MSAFEVGELVDISIRGARVDFCVQVGHREILRIAIGPRELELPLGTGIQVTRVAPREWPPQIGDVWEDAHEGSWWGRPHGKGGAELQAQDGGSSPSSFVLDRYGPLRLVYRRGWSPEPAPAAEAEPEPQAVDKRAEVIAGLRELADWYEANPGIPLDMYGWDMLTSISKPTEEAERAELLRVADLIGEPADLTATHPHVRRKFRGNVGYRAYYIPSAEPADGTADLTRGVGEVGVSAGVAEAPTAPDDELVWVAAVRKGIDYHDLGLLPGAAAFTTCSRSARRGHKMPRSEAAEFAKPCQRCYRDPAGVGVA